MSPSRHLFAAWNAIHEQVRRARRLALFIDFDGTLVPIRRHPREVRLSARVRELLGDIARNTATVGVVSGRSVDDVRNRVALAGIWYVGAHGFFLRDPGNRSHALLTPKQRARITRVHRALTRKLRGVPGISLEPKGATVAIHYRGTSRRSQEYARAVIAELLKKEPGLCRMAGKQVWEILPGRQTDKWRAIRFILGRESRQPVSRWLVFYLGDDTTDERVFEKMTGISIAVGKRHQTAARFFLRSPVEVRQFLRRWNEMIR